MALTTLTAVLAYAEQSGTAIPSFNIDNLEATEALMEAAEAERCPVILTIGQGAIRAGQMVHLSDLVQRLAGESKVPVVLHLDHSSSYDQIIRALRLGFTSVMYDGSHGALVDNIRESQAVVRAAHAVGVSVECELGAIYGVEDGISQEHPNLVDLGEVRQFIGVVDCDALAIGIGNAHGIYKAAPHLDFDRLRACREMHTPPLVLHGGSGIPDEMIRRAISLGIRKINVATELRLAFMKGLEKGAAGHDFYAMYEAAKANVRELATHKIRLFQGKQD